MSTASWTTWPQVRTGLRKRWDDGSLLRALGRGDPVAPLSVPVRAPTARQAAEDFSAVQAWAAAWHEAKVAPARVELAAIGGRAFGANQLPRRVWLDTPDDLWRLLGVSRDVAAFQRLLATTRQELPSAVDWVVAHPHRCLELAHTWPHLLAAARWIDERGGPSTYVRQIDAPGVDTKLIESHRGVLAALLDRSLPAERVHLDHMPSDFARRYGLRPKPELVRYRSFYPGDGPFTDVTVRVEELAAHPLAADLILVVENEVTFLALPQLAGAAVLLGGGYAVSRLAGLPWLAERRLAYWGDLDTHGFAILDRLRARSPHVRSVLMDVGTLLAHREHWGREPSPTSAHLPRLDADESALYRGLVSGVHGDALRLEQERVRFSTAVAALEEALR